MKTLTILMLDGSVVSFLSNYHTRKCIALEGDRVNLLSIQVTKCEGNFDYYFIHKDDEIVASKSIFTLMDHYQNRFKT